MLKTYIYIYTHQMVKYTSPMDPVAFEQFRMSYRGTQLLSKQISGDQTLETQRTAFFQLHDSMP